MSTTTVDPSLAARRFSQALLLVVSMVGLVLCPYSKVEESISIQAVSDLFYHGLSPLLEQAKNIASATTTTNTTATFKVPYDHLQYPGVVPRTFVGPLVLTTICHGVRLVHLLVMDLADHPMLVQFIARLALLAFQLQAWYRMARALDQKLAKRAVSSSPVSLSSSLVGTYLLVVTAVQFHLPFYASRFLANSFATVMTLHVYSDWILGRVERAACVLVVAMTLLRCDLILLVFTCGLSWLYTRQLTVTRAIRLGLQSMLLTLLLTIPLDSWLWQRWTWPEGVVLYENVVRNKSVDYGTSPWHWYATRAMPKAMLWTILLLPLCVLRLPQAILWTKSMAALYSSRMQTPTRSAGPPLPSCFDTTWLPYWLPAIGFVSLYSFLGHKEMRFLFPVLPLFNLAAAVGCTKIHELAWPEKDKPKTKVGLAVFVAMILLLSVSLMASLAFVMVSGRNYPGGQALYRLSRIVKESNAVSEVHVYIDVASAMTGVTLFGQRAAELYASNAKWSFVKGGYEDEHASMANVSKFTHILSENPQIQGFQLIETIQGYPRLDIRRRKIVTLDAIYILGRPANTQDRL